jgi:hypothetical protein
VDLLEVLRQDSAQAASRLVNAAAQACADGTLRALGSMGSVWDFRILVTACRTPSGVIEALPCDLVWPLSAMEVAMMSSPSDSQAFVAVHTQDRLW